MLKTAHVRPPTKLGREKFHDLSPVRFATKRILLINLVARGNGKHGKSERQIPHQSLVTLAAFRRPG
jgi:hypothetical protein